ncbi:osmoprotectant transport system substrate-binding protein/osmoprotectant transport system permease protein [Desulfitispora alkaliphila]|uniref:glycine betaine ABC transporter substrate-binding protein n=1 Tax=Desulfitispora alkaliphila TaxID=622674 RepID=UPI003D252001
MKKITALLVLLLAIFAIAGCGSDDGEEIVLAEGQFSEVDIMMHMAGILIEENTDLSVVYHDAMATVPGYNALQDGDIDIKLGYDGTLLTTILGYDPSDVPQDEELFDFAKRKGEEDLGVTLTEKFGFENTYALAIKEDFAEAEGIETISDIVPYTSDLIFGAEHEFFEEEGTMRFNPFNEYYGIEWKDARSIDIGLKYSAMDNENIDVTMVYSTDGLNRVSDLRVLEDDQNFFPEYFASHSMRDTLFEEYADSAPNLEEVLLMLEGQISNEDMIEMNYLADAEGEDPHEIAMDFLIERGLIEQ